MLYMILLPKMVLANNCWNNASFARFCLCIGIWLGLWTIFSPFALLIFGNQETLFSFESVRCGSRLSRDHVWKLLEFKSTFVGYWSGRDAYFISCCHFLWVYVCFLTLLFVFYLDTFACLLGSKLVSKHWCINSIPSSISLSWLPYIISLCYIDGSKSGNINCNWKATIQWFACWVHTYEFTLV